MKLSVVLALIVAGAFPALSLYAWYTAGPGYDDEDVVREIATIYLKNRPTFRFDGVPESVSLTSIDALESLPITWLVTLKFESRYAGYGDRSGQVLLPVITSHEMRLRIIRGVVEEAVIDGIWDELGQAHIYTEEKAVSVALEFLRNSPTFLYDGIPETVKFIGVEPLRCPYTWEVSISFDCRHAGYGDRKGMMLAQVITHHMIRVVIQRNEVVGAVIDDEWDEINQREVVRSELLPPEYAKDLAIEYVLENHPELGKIPIPEVWAFESLIPEGMVGINKVQYIGDGWTVNVTNPVVWKPVYTIEMEYSDMVSFYWEGTVDQSENIVEKIFKLIR
jgi:hypothetical protein